MNTIRPIDRKYFEKALSTDRFECHINMYHANDHIGYRMYFIDTDSDPYHRFDTDEFFIPIDSDDVSIYKIYNCYTCDERLEKYEGGVTPLDIILREMVGEISRPSVNLLSRYFGPRGDDVTDMKYDPDTRHFSFVVDETKISGYVGEYNIALDRRVPARVLHFIEECFYGAVDCVYLITQFKATSSGRFVRIHNNVFEPEVESGKCAYFPFSTEVSDE